MKKKDRFYYFVEGECEKKIIETFKEQKNLIVSGKVTLLNVVQNHISTSFLRTITENTTAILVFDTDTDSSEILSDNIRLLSENSHIKEVWCVMSVRNLEDELIRTTDITAVRMLTRSKSTKEYKHDLIIEKRLYEKLLAHHFDFSKLWITSPSGAFSAYKNNGKKIKL